MNGFYSKEFSPQRLIGDYVTKHYTHYPALEIDEDCQYVRFSLNGRDILESHIFFDSDNSDKNPFFEHDGVRYDLTVYFTELGQ